MTRRNVPGGLPLLRGRELAESHAESPPQPLARCLAVCEVLLGYPGVLTHLHLGHPHSHPHSGEQRGGGGGGHRKATWLENFTKGNVSIVMKVNNSRIVHALT